jgi:hypothetical protein
MDAVFKQNYFVFVSKKNNGTRTSGPDSKCFDETAFSGETDFIFVQYAASDYRAAIYLLKR